MTADLPIIYKTISIHVWLMSHHILIYLIFLKSCWNLGILKQLSHLLNIAKIIDSLSGVKQGKITHTLI